MAVGGAGRSGGTAIRPQSVATLKAITLRLASTASKQLPQLAASISDSIWTCRDILSAPQDSFKANSEVSVLVHRFKTHLSTLLQDRAVEARWAAVVLVKATIEAGGLETLSKSNAWVRNLLAILKKHDPPTTRALALIALTRIFMLTWEHTNLVREITTPALPTLISTCLNNASSNRCSARELQAILESFSTLLPRHPTIFRSNETQLRTLLSKIISSSSNGDLQRHFTKDHQETAMNVWTQLHYCAPKQTSAEKWETNFTSVIRAAHATCDRVFRSVNELWETVSGVQPSTSKQTLCQGECLLEDDEILGLEGWQGIDHGMQRLTALVQLLSSSLQQPTAGTVSSKIGQLIDLLSRILSIRISRDGLYDSPNPQIAKDERDALFAHLPGVHASTFELINLLLSRYGLAVTSIIQPLLTDVMAVVETELAYPAVRAALFVPFQQIIGLVGPSMTKQDIQEIEPVIRACCESVLATEPVKTEAVDVAIPSTKMHSQTFAEFDTTREAAQSLLPILISNFKPSSLSARARTLMERTAVLAQHKHAMVGCVLNPVTGGARAQASLLPILARQFPDCAEVEAIIRPRMPVILPGSKRNDDEEEEGEEEEEEEDSASKADPAIDTSGGDIEEVAMNGNAQQEEDATISAPTAVDKRNAPQEDTVERPAKRFRASPVAESSLPESTNFLPGPSTALDVPQTVQVSEPPVSTSLTSNPVTLPPPVAPIQQTVDDDDGSDFEMPPLTMDPDTDPEDD